MKVTATEVNDKKTIEAFRKLPFSIYKGDKYWIPAVRQDVEAVFDPKQNKFFRHGEAVRWIFSNEQGEVVGRVAAFINRKQANTYKQPTGGMGFFECIESEAVAFQIFDQCKQWLQERGMEAMDGPINFGEKDKFWGLITENFEMPPYYGQNYNPAYYKRFFEAYGFQVYYNQLVFFRKVSDPLQDKFQDRYLKIKNDPNYHCEHISKSKLSKYAEDFRTVYNRAWVTHDNFKGMPKEQAMSIMNKLKPVLDERLIWFVYYQGTPVGFYISLPELNEIFKRVGDNLNLIGKLKFLYYKTLGICRNSFGVAFGIDPAHQGKGIEGFMFQHMAEVIQRKKLYDGIIITWIGDFNPKMIAIIKSLGGSKIRQMATYRKLFSPDAVFERAPLIDR